MKTRIAKLCISFFSFLFIFSCTNGCTPSNRAVINASVKGVHQKGGQNLTINGSLDAPQIAVKNLVVNGSAELGPEPSFINGTLQINGSLEGSSLDVKEDAQINGHATIKNSHFWGDLEINGSADLEDTIVEGNVLISKKIVLRNNVTIKGRLEFIEEPGVAIIRGQDIHILQGIVNGRAESQTTAPVAPAVHF